MDTFVKTNRPRWNNRCRAIVLDWLSSDNNREEFHIAFSDVPGAEAILRDWLVNGPNLDELNISLDQYVRTALAFNYTPASEKNNA